MKTLEERYGKDFPVVRGDYMPYWEDGAASTSEATAICRDAKERLIHAETLWAISDPDRYVRQVDLFDSAWSDLLMYDEHTWGASKSVHSRTWKPSSYRMRLSKRMRVADVKRF